MMYSLSSIICCFCRAISASTQQPKPQGQQEASREEASGGCGGGRQEVGIIIRAIRRHNKIYDSRQSSAAEAGRRTLPDACLRRAQPAHGRRTDLE